MLAVSLVGAKYKEWLQARFVETLYGNQFRSPTVLQVCAGDLALHAVESLHPKLS